MDVLIAWISQSHFLSLDYCLCMFLCLRIARIWDLYILNVGVQLLIWVAEVWFANTLFLRPRSCICQSSTFQCTVSTFSSKWILAFQNWEGDSHARGVRTPGPTIIKEATSIWARGLLSLFQIVPEVSSPVVFGPSRRRGSRPPERHLYGHRGIHICASLPRG